MGSKIQPLLNPSLTTERNLSGQAVAIDACTWLHQFLKVNAYSKRRLVLQDKTCRLINHLRGFLYRTIHLLEKDIWPVFVFDGVKSEKVQRGDNTMISLRKSHERAFKYYKGAMDHGMGALAKNLGKRLSLMYPIAMNESKKLLRYLGMPVVEAPGEGEAQCHQLLATRVVDAVVTQDADALLFGSKVVLKHLAVTRKRKVRKVKGTLGYQSGTIEKHVLYRVLRELDITREQLVDIGLLVGTDFNEGVRGIGPKTALKLVHEFEYIEDIAINTSKYDFSDLGIDNPKRTPFSAKLDNLRNIFLHPVVDEGITGVDWQTPNGTKVRQLLLEGHSFSESLVEKALCRMEKAIA